jgi:hypothetical protein
VEPQLFASIASEYLRHGSEVALGTCVARLIPETCICLSPSELTRALCGRRVVLCLQPHLFGSCSPPDFGLGADAAMLCAFAARLHQAQVTANADGERAWPPVDAPRRPAAARSPARNSTRAARNSTRAAHNSTHAALCGASTRPPQGSGITAPRWA